MDSSDVWIGANHPCVGQWDYGNKWAQDGCESGACLRSHVNLTETMLTLAMITKAGVTTYQIAVGISSYGRSFKMTVDKIEEEERKALNADVAKLGDRASARMDKLKAVIGSCKA